MFESSVEIRVFETTLDDERGNRQFESSVSIGVIVVGSRIRTHFLRCCENRTERL